jgi:hypothetical protein
MPAAILRIAFCFLFVAVTGCKEKYEPLPVITDNHFLVVEGFINTNGTTNIKLSRTIRLADSARPMPESGALVTVEGVNNTFFLLQESAIGNYTSSQVSLPDLSFCRLRIVTNAGKEYVTSDIQVKPVPPIDSVNWERTEAGVNTYVNTHDAANQTRYYLWEYREDWEFRSTYTSHLEYINDQIVQRDPSINISRCWQSIKSSRIITATTSHLTNDVIQRIPITYIPQGSWMLGVKYSVEVKQYPLTKEGFQFWENVKKNSEQLGTIFDPMPSQTSGNIRCVTDPEEPVIGFISAGTSSVQRIFINHADVFPWVVQNACSEIFVISHPDSVKMYFGDWGFVPEYEQRLPAGYVASTPLCIDCRLRGINVKPPFWP